MKKSSVQKRLCWSELTLRQKRQLGGGCGPGKLMLCIPQFIFKASCEQHDFYYRRGGWLFDKLTADFMFLAFMSKDISDSDNPWWKKAFYLLMALLYYVIVSLFLL